MTPENRNHQRIQPHSLQANLTFSLEDQEIALNADILDISYSGIRVKLKEPIAADMEGHIRINMILPQSGYHFCVHGLLKHQPSDDEAALHYVEHIHSSVDDRMFECVELDETTMFIKTY